MRSVRRQASARERCLQRVSQLQINTKIKALSWMEGGPPPCLPPLCRLVSLSSLLFQFPFPLDHQGWLSLTARTSGAESHGRLLPPGPPRGGMELSWPWDRTAPGVGRATAHVPVSPTSLCPVPFQSWQPRTPTTSDASREDILYTRRNTIQL